MFRLSRLRPSLLLVLAASLSPFSASSAATFNWANITGSWSNPAAWTPTGPPSGADPTDVLVFGGDVGSIAGSAPNYTSTNDINVVPFVLNGITLQATDLNNQPTDPPIIIAGNRLGFTGASANVTQNGAGPVTFNTPVSFSSGLTLTGNGTGAVTFNRGLSGSGDIVKTGSSVFRFGTFPILPATTAPSENTWMGTLMLNGGIIRFNNNAESGRTALRANGVTLSTGTTLSCTSQLRTGVISGPGGTIESQVTANNVPNEDVVITALDSGTFAGTIRLGTPTGTGNDTGTLTIRGPGVQILNGTLNIEKDVAVAGSLVFSGAAQLGDRQKGAVVMQGGSFRLDNVETNNPNRLRDASNSSTGVDVVGGGVFTLDGNTAGTNEIVGRLQLASLAGGTARTRPRSGHLRFDIVQRGGATALNLQSYNRDATTATALPLNTVEFAARDASGATLELGQSSSSPRVQFLTAPAFQNLLLASTEGSIQTGWATVRTASGLAFATHGANGIVAVSPSTNWVSNSVAHLENATSQTVSGTFSAASIRLVPTAPGQQITVGSGAALNTTGIILTGGNDFEIGGAGNLTGGAPRFIHVDAGTLTISTGIQIAGTGSQPMAKSGAGVLSLTNAANPNNATTAKAFAINQGTLRVRLSPSSVPGSELQLRGGVLEFEGGGSFSRALVINTLVSGPNTINWSGSELAGTPAEATNLTEDRGSGGFAAKGGNATVDLGVNGAGVIRWEERSFIQSGYALILGSPTADSSITLIDNFNLTSAEATVAYNAREVRVIDNPTSTSDRAILSGVIGGTIHNDLLKTGAGILELGGNCTFAGAALIQEGTLAVTGSMSQSIVADIRSGGTLAGTGTVSAIILEGGGTLAPGVDAAPGKLTGTSLTWRPNGTARFDLGSANASDSVNLGTGALLKGGAAGPFTFDFNGTGSLGSSYTLATFGATDFSASDFTAANLAPGVTGSFQISSGTLLFVTGAPPAPEVVTGNASNVGVMSATVNGTVNARGGTTTARFEYGTTTAYGSFVDVTPAIGSGIAPVAVSANLANLQPGTLYHFRLVGTNGGGTTNGSDGTFTTSTAVGPTVVTGESSSVSNLTAIVAGMINPNGLPATAAFEYGTTTQYGSTAPVSPDPGSGTTPVPVSATLSNLQPGTLYHYRLVGTSAGGQVQGSDATFTTQNGAPVALTLAATNVSDKTARLNGSVNPSSAATTVFFEYGVSSAYGTTATVPNVPSGNTVVPVSTNVTGLLPSTTYHYRVVAQNASGTTLGDDMTFVTSQLVTAPMPADDNLFVTNKAVTINVLANDINPETGDSIGLTFDKVTVPPQFGAVSGDATLTYTPGKNFPSSGDTFTYQVSKADGQTAMAKVSVSTFKAVKGSFATTIEEDGPGVSDTGSLAVTLSSTGKCTAKLVWERQSYSIKGTVAADGSSVLTAQKSGGGNLNLSFNLNVDGTAPGSITDDATGETYAFGLTRAGADVEGGSIAPGIYTAWLPGDATVPGTGYIVVTVDKKRTARISGQLSDGATFVDKSTLTGHHYVLDPLLYKVGKTYGGQLRSEVQFTGGQTLGSEAEWFKDLVPGAQLYPNGVAVPREVVGEKFAASASGGYTAITTALGGTSVQLVLEGGGLPATEIVPLTLSPKKVIVGATSLQGVSVKLNSKQGTFSGTFTHPAGQTSTFGGAFRSTQKEGRGYFIGVNVPGEVRITTTP